MILSQKGLMLVKGFEGFHSHSYKDSGGIWTVGWGQTGTINGQVIGEGTVITCQEGEAFLQNQIKYRGGVLESKAAKYGITLTQNQFDVFISRMYNFVVNSRLHDTLFKLMQSNAPQDKIEASILTGTRDKAGNVLNGLVIRRSAEYELWSTGNLTKDTINRYNSKIKVCGGTPVSNSSGTDTKPTTSPQGNIDNQDQTVPEQAPEQPIELSYSGVLKALGQPYKVENMNTDADTAKAPKNSTESKETKGNPEFTGITQHQLTQDKLSVDTATKSTNG